MEEIISWRRVCNWNPYFFECQLERFAFVSSTGMATKREEEKLFSISMKLLWELLSCRWNPQSLFVGGSSNSVVERKIKSSNRHWSDVGLRKLERIKSLLILFKAYALLQKRFNCFMLITTVHDLSSCFQLIWHSDELSVGSSPKFKIFQRKSSLKWFNKISFSAIMIIACVQWNSFAIENPLRSFMASRKNNIAAEQTKRIKHKNCFFINKQKTAVKSSPDNRFPFSSSPLLVWYFIVDSATPKQSIVGGTMEN